MDEIYSKTPKKKYSTNKTEVYQIDDIWSLDNLDLKVYGLEITKNYRHILVIIDNFSKFAWTIPLKTKNAQTIKDSFKNILLSSKRKPNLLERDRDRGFYYSIFRSFLNNNKNKLYSRYNSFSSVFVERFNRTLRDLLKKPVF